MVFAGQDAWRKHPLISGCWKKPLPGLGTAVAIFSVYLLFDAMNNLSQPTVTRKKHVPKIHYSIEADGEMPSAQIGDHN